MEEQEEQLNDSVTASIRGKRQAAEQRVPAAKR